jgi:LPS O-antigen subunit length determinant protein (WzzB/FepE family)
MTMQTARILQAVVLMMIVAMAASCAASKEYTSKLFAPRTMEVKDSQVLAVSQLRFLEIDSVDDKDDNWVSTDIIMGRDSSGSTTSLDKLANTIPVKKTVVDSTGKNEPAKTAPAIVEASKTVPMETAPVARNANPGEVRSKRTREK